MGRSRRERVVTLTKTRKQKFEKENKQEFLQNVRSKIDDYARIYVFSSENMRNSLLKGLRAQWKDSRFIFGRKRVMQVALGRNVEEEYLDGLHEVSEQLEGDVGLFFTNREHDAVVRFFNDYSESEFARSGFEATEHVELLQGPLHQFEPNQVANLRLVGLPVDVKKGVVSLTKNITICDAGDVLTPEKAKVLEFLGIRMANFQIVLRCHYEKEGALFELLEGNIEKN